MIDKLSSGLLGPALLQIQNLDAATVIHRLLLLSAYSFILFLVWFTIRAVYNIWFHPLSKYPGPWYAHTTDLVQYYMSISGGMVPWQTSLHEKHGHIVRTGPSRLTITDPQAWRDIHGHRVAGKKQSVLKDWQFYTGHININNTASIITEIDDVKHGQIRKIFSNAFSDKALRSQQELFDKHIDKMIALVKSKMVSEGKTDAVKFLNYTTFDVMGDLTLGDDLGMLRSGKYIPWVTTIFAHIKAAHAMTLLLRWKRLGRVVEAILPPSAKKAMHDHNNFIIERVDARMALDHVEKPDIWSLVVNDDGSKRVDLTPNALYSNASVFMLAGTETLSTLTSGLTYLLLTHPENMERLVKEIRGVEGGEKGLTVDGLARLKYLQACLDEAMRFYPPVPNGAPRLIPDGGASVCGEYLPGGTRLQIPHFAMFRSERNFKDAQSFVPERWLPEGAERYGGDKKEAWQPFSYGPRNCIGKNLAYHEMRLIMAKILWHFDLELCKESERWIDQETFNLWYKPELMIRAKTVVRD